MAVELLEEDLLQQLALSSKGPHERRLRPQARLGGQVESNIPVSYCPTRGKHGFELFPQRLRGLIPECVF